MALYKAAMNINEDGHWPHGWHGFEGDRWIKCDTPTFQVQYLDFYICFIALHVVPREFLWPQIVSFDNML